MGAKTISVCVLYGLLCALIIPFPWSMIVAGIGGYIIGTYSDKIERNER
jgi:hypothetical protein